MLCVSLLQAASIRAVATAFSPSKTGRVRVPCNAMSGASLSSPATTWYRYDPYMCRVLASPLKTPTAAPVEQYAPAAVPAANRGLLNILNAANVHAAAAPTHAAAAVPAMMQALTGDATATVTVAPSSAPRYASIRFKHDVLVYLAPFRVNVGDQVLVEGDRGEDFGVIESLTLEKPSYPVPLRITRKATQKDRDMLLAKRAKEEAAVRSAQALADSVGLSLTIADCEFQYDFGKLTVFFQSKSRHVDFRKLQRGLFREFRCRIWLTEAYRHIDEAKPTKAM